MLDNDSGSVSPFVLNIVNIYMAAVLEGLSIQLEH